MVRNGARLLEYLVAMIHYDNHDEKGKGIKKYTST